MKFRENITHNTFPEQSSYVGKAVKVVFHWDVQNRLHGVIVRDDTEEPYVMIIKLDDGRHVLGTECQHSPMV